MNTFDEDLTFGIIGLGDLGRMHAEALDEIGFEFQGADANDDLRAQFEKEFEVPVHDDPHPLLQSNPDGVILSVPTKYHEGLAKQVFADDIDVLIENPLSHSLESARRIKQSALESDSICMVGFPNRLRNVVDVTKNYIDDGYFGKITHIEGKIIRRRGIPGRGTWYTSKDIAGGGSLIDIGSHVLFNALDFINWQSPEEMISVGRSDFGQDPDYKYLNMWGEDKDGEIYNVEDTTHSFIQFENNTTLSLEVAWAENTPTTHTYRILGTNSGAEIDITEPNVAVEPTNRNDLRFYDVDSKGVDHYINSDIIVNDNNPYRRQIELFVKAINSRKRPPICNVHQAYKVQEIISELYENTTFSR